MNASKSTANDQPTVAPRGHGFYVVLDLGDGRESVFAITEHLHAAEFICMVLADNVEQITGGGLSVRGIGVRLAPLPPSSVQIGNQMRSSTERVIRGFAGGC